MSIIKDEVYNNLQWKLCTIEDLQELIQGTTVLETDIIDFYDGVELILKDKKEQIIVIKFEADTDNYTNKNDVIRSHKSQKQHRRYLELEETLEAEEANPMFISWAIVTEK